MLTGKYGEHENVTVDFTSPACVHIAGTEYIAEVTVTISEEGNVIESHVARLPLSQHISNSEVIKMFEDSFSNVFNMSSV